MPIYNVNGDSLVSAYNVNAEELLKAYNANGDLAFQKYNLPVPTGDLNANEIINLPDLYEAGKGFTCTGLAHDEENDTYLIGDIGILLPNSGTIRSQIVRVNNTFTTVVETIPLYTLFPNMQDVQGICIDTTDNTIWLCSPSENLIRHITKTGTDIDSISITSPTGISYDKNTDTFWVLDYSKHIKNVDKSGNTLATYNFAYNEALDQCFLDTERGYLYITAGVNYSGRNNVYLFDVNTHSQSITCTVDSYSVEGIVIETTRMIIVNDGYYHSAQNPHNTANIYNLT